MIELNLHSSRDGENQVEKVLIPERMAEFTAMRYVLTIQVIEKAEDWLVDFFALQTEIQQIKFGEFTDVQYSQYFAFLLDIIGAASGIDLSFLLNLSAEEHDQSVVPLAYTILSAIGEYKPEEMDSFTHKGVTYIFPESVKTTVGEFEQTTFGPQMTAGRVIEALRRREVFGVKNENGESQIKHGLYYSDLGMIASLARKVKPDGSEEIPPIDLEAFGEFVNVRMLELEDIPADIFRNAGAFLMGLSIQSATTHISNIYSPVARQTRKTRRKRGK